MILINWRLRFLSRFLICLLCLVADIIFFSAKVSANPPQPYLLKRQDNSYWLISPTGTPLLHLAPQIRIQYAKASFSDSSANPLPPWTTKSRPQFLAKTINFRFLAPTTLPNQGWALTAMADAGPMIYQLRLEQHSARDQLALSLLAQYRTPVFVRQESLLLRVAPGLTAQTLDRAYRLVTPRQDMFVDQLTPHFATFSTSHESTEESFTLTGTSSVTGFWLHPRGRRSFLLEFELDHAQNHPRIIYQPPRFLATAQLRAPRFLRGRRADENLLSPGDNRSMQIFFNVGEAPPLLISRYPWGRRAAIVFTDHADQSNTAKLEALAFGRTGAIAAGELGPNFPGLVNRGLIYTKSIFLQQAAKYPAQFDNPSYRHVLDELQRRGVEIGLHSPSGISDPALASRSLLQDFQANYTGRTWIDHQPTSNREALASLGAMPANPYFLLPALIDSGFRYFWTAEDLSLVNKSINLLAPSRPAIRRPLIFSQFDEARLVSPKSAPLFFSSTNLFINLPRLDFLFSSSNLSQFIEERGLLLAHVYLDTHRRAGRFGPRQLITTDDRTFHYRLLPKVDAIFQRLADKQQSEQLWVTTVDALCSHLLATRQINLSRQENGFLQLASRDGQPISGVTLLLPPQVAAVKLPPQQLVSFTPAPSANEWSQLVINIKDETPLTIVLKDAAGEPVTLTSSAIISLGP